MAVMVGLHITAKLSADAQWSFLKKKQTFSLHLVLVIPPPTIDHHDNVKPKAGCESLILVRVCDTNKSGIIY